MARNREINIENDDDDLLGGDEQTKASDELPPRNHNGGPSMQVGNIAADQLRSIVERIERLNEEKANIAADIRDVLYEAKANGYCPKTIRKIVQLRKLDTHERDEQEYTLDLYKRALGLAIDLD